MTGIGSVYEPPEEAEVVIGESMQPDEAAERILSRLRT
jgi:adenylylsulfate kinase-like enzyme